MIGLLVVAVAALASITAASAQPVTVPDVEPPASAFGPDHIVQITATFRARIEGVTDAREVPSTTAQDSARRTLYNMAANECTVLAEYWKAECQLNRFSVFVPRESLEGPGAVVPSMFGTAVYELRLQSPGR